MIHILLTRVLEYYQVLFSESNILTTTPAETFRFLSSIFILIIQKMNLHNKMDIYPKLLTIHAGIVVTISEFHEKMVYLSSNFKQIPW